MAKSRPDKKCPASTGEQPEHHWCPIATAIELIANQWTVHLLWTLHKVAEPIRFRKLQRKVAPITQKELTKRLRSLERSGLVHRRVYAEVPPKVEYQLTNLGTTLIPVLIALDAWARRYGPEIEANQNNQR